ncbi:MAG: hypothetical protein AB2748_22175, partial [Candidatus Thiodiazotropha endolucinida]
CSKSKQILLTETGGRLNHAENSELFRPSLDDTPKAIPATARKLGLFQQPVLTSTAKSRRFYYTINIQL